MNNLQDRWIPKKLLNLGCGKKIKEGFINVDIFRSKGVDQVWNLNNYPYPFKSDIFDLILADNVLEHLDSSIRPLEEIWRIAKKDAEVEIIVPLAPTSHAFRDPTHKQFYTYRTWEYFTDMSNLNYYSQARFEILEKKIMLHNRLRWLDWTVNICPKFMCEFFSQFFPPAFIKVNLRVIK